MGAATGPVLESRPAGDVGNDRAVQQQLRIVVTGYVERVDAVSRYHQSAAEAADVVVHTLIAGGCITDNIDHIRLRVTVDDGPCFIDTTRGRVPPEFALQTTKRHGRQHEQDNHCH